MTLTFRDFCAALGTEPPNKRAWCAHSSHSKIAIFTLWEDELVNGLYEFSILPPSGEGDRNPWRKNLLNVLNLAIDGKFSKLGIICVAADSHSRPRERKSFERERIAVLELKRTSASVVGRVIAYQPTLWGPNGELCGIGPISEAIDDISSSAIGNPDPEYLRRMSGSYERDVRIRQLVLERAAGRCEFCGQDGFVKQNGEVFLECHHIISLSEQGPDLLTNVIALCPNHHREAHYGKRWEWLQDKFLENLRKLAN